MHVWDVAAPLVLIEEAGGRAILVKAEAGSTAEMAAAVADSAQAFGRFDGLINNSVGMVSVTLHQDMSVDYSEQWLDTHAPAVALSE